MDGLKKKANARKLPEVSAKERLFDDTVNEVRKAFADLSADELQRAIDEALASVRKARHPNPR